MKREDVEKLLGGYASGTLTDAERQALCEAALSDQEIFDALVEEETLREILADPRARRRLMDATEPRRRHWFERPVAWAMAGSLAAVTGAAVIVLHLSTMRVAELPRQVAMQALRAPEIAPAAPGAPPAAEPERPAVAPRVKRRAEAPLPEKETKTEMADARGAAAPPPPAAAVAPSSMPAPPPPPPPPAAETAPPPARDLLAEQAAATAPPAATAFRGAVGGVAGGIAGVPNLSPALRCTVQRRTPDGKFADLPPGATLDPTDTIQLSVEALRSGFLSVVQAEDAGKVAVLTPRMLRVETGNHYVLGPYQFPEQRGDKRLTLVLTDAMPLAMRTSESRLRDEKARQRAAILRTEPDERSPQIAIDVVLPYRRAQ